MNVDPCFPYLLSELGEMQYEWPAYNVQHFVKFMKISAGELVFFLWVLMKLHLNLCHENVWHFESTDVLVKSVCCVTEDTICSLVPLKPLIVVWMMLGVLLFVSMDWKSFMIMLYRISVSTVVIIHVALSSVALDSRPEFPGLMTLFPQQMLWCFSFQHVWRDSRYRLDSLLKLSIAPNSVWVACWGYATKCVR